MINPMTTELGDTYEKESLFNFISQNGSLDPISKQPLKQNKIYNNLNLK